MNPKRPRDDRDPNRDQQHNQHSFNGNNSHSHKHKQQKTHHHGSNNKNQQSNRGNNGQTNNQNTADLPPETTFYPNNQNPALVALNAAHASTTTHAAIPPPKHSDALTSTILQPNTVLPGTGSAVTQAFTSTSIATDPLPSLPVVPPGPLLTATFTHPSVVDESKHRTTFAPSTTPTSSSQASLNNPPPYQTYERLEFLGDAYIELFASRLIIRRFPQLTVGRISQLREHLVRNSTLAALSQRYGFRAKVRFNDSVGKDAMVEFKFRGGWEKVDADVFEGYVAAVILSTTNGVEICEKWLEGCWAGTLLREGSGQGIGAGESIVNRKVELGALVETKEVRIEYLSEDSEGRVVEIDGTKGSGHSSLGAKKNGNGKMPKDDQVQVMGVYILDTTDLSTDSVDLVGNASTSMSAKGKRYRLGGGSGVGKRDASQRACMDAFVRSGEIIEEFALRKKKETQERRARLTNEREEQAAAGAKAEVKD